MFWENWQTLITENKWRASKCLEIAEGIAKSNVVVGRLSLVLIQYSTFITSYRDRAAVHFITTSFLPPSCDSDHRLEDKATTRHDTLNLDDNTGSYGH